MRVMPSQQDVSQMSSWMDALSDAPSDPKNKAISTPADVQGMKDLLAGINDIVGDTKYVPDPTMLQPQAVPSQPLFLDNSDMSYEEYEASLNNPMTKGPVYKDYTLPTQQAHMSLPDVKWVVVSESYPGSKTLQVFKIQQNSTNVVIINNILLKESANAICSLLNDGATMDSTQILGILSSGVQYSNEVKKVFENLKSRSKCLVESNYQQAAKYDESISKLKENAQKIKGQLVEYLTEKNIRYKY